jgi:hypothetical protein
MNAADLLGTTRRTGARKDPIADDIGKTAIYVITCTNLIYVSPLKGMETPQDRLETRTTAAYSWTGNLKDGSIDILIISGQSSVVL